MEVADSPAMMVVAMPTGHIAIVLSLEGMIIGHMTLSLEEASRLDVDTEIATGSRVRDHAGGHRSGGH